MPRKGKRAGKPLEEATSTKRIKSTATAQEHDGSLDKETDTNTVCSRCAELDIPKVVSSLQPRDGDREGLTTRLSNLIVQRLFFDISYPVIPSCTACTGLDKEMGIWNGIGASRLYQRDLSIAECQKICAESWFQRQGKQLVRCSERPKSPSFSVGIFNRSGNGYFEQEHFEPHLTGGAREVFTYPDYAAIKAWLKDCSLNHLKCQPRKSDTLKLISLIDVNTRRLVRYPIDTHDDCDYFALSYVWGDTKQSTYQFGEIPKILPRTIDDSIKVVKELGKNYLWVDSICIDQANEDDKKAQIAIMDTVYECAFATIVALDGENANSGLPGVSGHVKRTAQFLAEFGQNRMIDTLPTLRRQLQNSIWATRAWTFQEGLLSRRRLFFAKHQVYFCCNEMDCCESHDTETTFGSTEQDSEEALPRYAKDPFMDDNLRRQPLNTKIKLCEEVINGYTPRKLTNDSDSLNAISALLNYMQRVLLNDGFLYGLPLTNFRGSILWHQQGVLNGSMNSGFHVKLNTTTRRTASHIPSWSWLAWKLPQEIRISQIWYETSVIQAPLKVFTHGGREIDVGVRIDDKPVSQMKEVQIPDVEEVKGQQEVQRQIISATENFYAHVRARKIRDKTAWSSTTRVTHRSASNIHVPDHCLLIEGIILHFATMVGEYSGMTWATDKRAPVPQLAVDDLTRRESVYVNWRNDGYIDRLKPPGAEKSTIHDFLLVSATADGWKGKEVVLELLHLYWKDGVAFRGGVVSVYVDPKAIEQLWDVSKGEMCRFWLG